MNFFDDQDRARRKTTRLVVLFVLAVLFTLVAVNGVAALIVNAATKAPDIRRKSYPAHKSYVPNDTPIEIDTPWPPPEVQQPAPARATRPAWWRPDVFAYVTLATLAIIVGGSLVKIAMLSGGGRTVAEMMGGRLLSPSSADPDERKVLNVVEEMAIAASLPVPPVYIMDSESGINAFAAGFTPRDAVIAVTAGTVKNLTRDELQGVVGHEFSHVLNGDMRLNIRLMGILFGILLIALIGWQTVRIAAHSGGSRKDDGKWRIALIVVGLAAVVIGYIGYFLGRLMQCAVSRQREFLADASAVQFTRNPAGIAGALKKIAGLSYGSQLVNDHALETSHLLFGDPVTHAFSDLLATHPPIAERIRRLDPNFTGQVPSRTAAGWVDRPEPAAGFASATVTAPAMPRVAAAGLVDQVGRVTPQHVAQAVATVGALPGALVAAAREPFAAPALLFSLLLHREPVARATQLGYLSGHVDPAVYRQTQELAPFAANLPADARLPLLSMSFPALRQLSPPQVNGLLQSVKVLIEADEKVELFEYAVFTILRRQLAPAVPAGVRFYSLRPLREDAAVLLAALAWAGDKQGPAALAAFSAGMARLDDGGQTPLPAPPAIPAIDAALGRLAQSAPGIKRRIIDAAAYCVAADGIVHTEEGELLRAVCAVLDCPMPPILSSQEPVVSSQ